MGVWFFVSGLRSIFFALHVDVHLMGLNNVLLNDIIGRVVIMDRVVYRLRFFFVDEVYFPWSFGWRLT
jgi:hypothetical protein